MCDVVNPLQFHAPNNISNDGSNLEQMYISDVLEAPHGVITTFRPKDAYISSWDIPELSNMFKQKLIIAEEINEIVLADPKIEYVMFNLLKIIDSIIQEYSINYCVEVALETDEDNPCWKHADITVKLNDDPIGSEIWKRSSKEAKKFYMQVENNKIMLHEDLKRIHKFIYIIVD